MEIYRRIFILRLIYIVTHEDNGRRAVDVLCSRTGMSRLMSKKVRLYGSLTCNGKHIRMIESVAVGDVLEAQYWPEGKHNIELRDDPLLPVIFQDDWLIIVNKPAGMVTHPTYLHEKGSVTDRLADQHLHPVIRLDRDTSGLLLIAMNGHAHHVISSHSMDKSYVALVHGKLPQKSGIIDLPIGRDPNSIMLRRIDENGSSAQTIWTSLHYFKRSNVSFVKYKLITGRTHQIRLHSKSIGHPLLGDWLYGIEETAADTDKQADKFISRQALHAASLTFTHPETLKKVTVSAPLPMDFKEALTQLYQAEKEDL
jgi:23S rRNA pseudouridine1911/1915/1917 synthase